MRILITGATGLIGRELDKALAARGDTLVCLLRTGIVLARQGGALAAMLPMFRLAAQCLRWRSRPCSASGPPSFSLARVCRPERASGWSFAHGALHPRRPGPSGPAQLREQLRCNLTGLRLQQFCDDRADIAARI